MMLKEALEKVSAEVIKKSWRNFKQIMKGGDIDSDEEDPDLQNLERFDHLFDKICKDDEGGIGEIDSESDSENENDDCDCDTGKFVTKVTIDSSKIPSNYCGNCGKVKESGL